MRRDRACSSGTRSSALWGRGSKSESRSSALWGRRGGRASVVVAAALALAVPVAGVAGSNGHPAGALVTPSLIKGAHATPDATFNVIVEGTQGASSKGIGDDVATGNGKLKRKFLSITGVSASISGKDLLKLAKNPHVSAIVPDTKMKTSDYQNAEMWRTTTGVSSLLSKPAVTCAVSSLTGLQLDPTCVPSAAFLAPPAPAIAIVDSGIDASKAADFGARVVARGDFVAAAPASGDPEGHGTMVAGLAAGGASSHIGASPTSNLVDVRVANSQGMALTSDILAGLDWILANKAQYGIKVVNMSLAGSAETSITFDPLDQAVEKLWLNGLVVVAAAGNHGQPDSAVKLSSPGNDPFVITVGAVDQNGTSDTGDDFRAPWSAYGYTADGFHKPDLVAPGRFMVSPIPDGSYIKSMEPDRVTAPGYIWMSGTSFSSPIVAGAAAQVLAAHPGYTPDQVKGALLATARGLGSAPGLGAGEVNAAAAVALASPPNPNQNLNAFVSVDPATGLNTFTAANWVSAVQTSANWTEANWTSANWTEANWTEANWTLANWTEANWTEANWTEANWTEANWTLANWTEANWVE
jgi:serine protease AprX